METKLIDNVLSHEELYCAYRTITNFKNFLGFTTLSDSEKLDYINVVYVPQFLKIFDFDTNSKNIEDLLFNLGQDFIIDYVPTELENAFYKYYISCKQKRWRTRGRINFMLEYKRVYEIMNERSKLNLHWLTFTFTNDFINLDTQTLRTYVIRYLRTQSLIDYIGNVDYGKERERLHFHVLVLTDHKLNYKPWHKLGYIRDEHFNCDNVDKMTSYIDKMANHEVKIKANHTIIKNGHQVNVYKLTPRHKYYNEDLFQYMFLGDIEDLTPIDCELEELPF